MSLGRPGSQRTRDGDGLNARLATRRQTRTRPTAGTALSGGTRWTAPPAPLFHFSEKDYVSRGGALTSHLSCLGQVTVRVVSEGVAFPWRDERAALAPSPRRTARHAPSRTVPAWCRDVVLSIDGAPCVVAHSVTPLRHSRAQWKAMRVLRTRPLAELLYADRSVRRSSLVSRRAGAVSDPLHGLVRRAGVSSSIESDQMRRRCATARGWVVRRSLFERHGAPLMITECFLPAFWALLRSSE